MISASKVRIGLTILFSIIFFGNFSSEAAEHRRLVVSANGQNCSEAQFTHIQDAVDASSPHDTIHVCNGVYQEQLHITKSLNLDADDGAYLAPTNMRSNATSLTNGDPLAAAIYATGAKHIEISGLTVDPIASGINSCSPRLIGVYYQNASGVIDTVRIRNTKLAVGLDGCQSGTAIFVQSGNGGKSEVEIKNCPISEYQKNGITANEPGTVVSIHDNVVTGIGATTGAAQNGIQIGFGASGGILRNLVTGNFWSPCQVVAICQALATDILTVQSDNVRVIGNTVIYSQVGIFMHGNKGIVGLNKASLIKVFDGVRIEGNENIVRKNEILDSAESDVFVQGNDNSIENNILSNAPVGVLKTEDSIGNRIEDNEFINVNIRVQDPPSMPLARKVVPEH